VARMAFRSALAAPRRASRNSFPTWRGAQAVYSCVREIANSRRNPPETVDDVLAELERAGLVQSVATLRLG
jgi:hypothetical protein